MDNVFTVENKIGNTIIRNINLSISYNAYIENDHIF